MLFPKIVLALVFSTSALLTASSGAQAFTFVTNDFDENPLSKDDSKEDIFLESVKILDADGDFVETISEFSYITSAQIVSNDEYTGGNSGAASTDKGDEASTGTQVENASEADIVVNLGSRNLNNIIDTEDRGSFQIDLHFDKVMDNLLVWERGMNSDLRIQALDSNGNLVGNALTITDDLWFNANFSIDTLEIRNAQKVGSFGVNIAQDLGVKGGISSLRFSSESVFNGPDWKFVGTDGTRKGANIPEPTFILGLGMVGGVLAIKKRGHVA